MPSAKTAAASTATATATATHPIPTRSPRLASPDLGPELDLSELQGTAGRNDSDDTIVARDSTRSQPQRLLQPHSSTSAATTAGPRPLPQPSSSSQSLRADGADGAVRRQSRFVEDMPLGSTSPRPPSQRQVREQDREVDNPATAAAVAAAPSPDDSTVPPPTSTPSAGAADRRLSRLSSSPSVDPATIPIRTSSHRATSSITNGQTSPKAKTRATPRKHKSLSGFGGVKDESVEPRGHSSGKRPRHLPEVDEKVWIGQAKQGRRVQSMQQPYGFPMPPSGTPFTAVRESGRREDPVGGARPATMSGVETILAARRADTSPTAGPSAALSAAIAAADALLINGDGDDGTSWTSEKENILKGPFDYLEAHPGKDIRTQLITAFDAWLQVPAPSLAIITKVVGMLHTASLLIDDVEDSSILRRGVPVAHSIFGTAQTINSANYVYFAALQELLRLPSAAECVKIYTDELLNLHRGQGMDLFWRDTLTCPSEDDYLEMVGNKTGGLFRLAIKLMCAESPLHNNFRPDSSSTAAQNVDSPASSKSPSSSRRQTTKTDYIPLVNTIGLLFQILDDYRNLSDSLYTTNKGLCEDLTEGKFSFPIIHAIRSQPQNLVLINILKQKPTDEEVKRYAVAYMEDRGSFSYTRRVLRGLTKKAVGLVEEIEAEKGGSGRESAGGQGIKAILEKLRVDGHKKAVSMG